MQAIRAMTLLQKKALYKKAVREYEQGTPVMTDAQFNKLERIIAKEAPTWKGLQKTGAPVSAKHKKTKVAVHNFMPSLHKRFQETVGAWFSKREGPFALMAKMDGSALQLTCENGVPTKLVTRGDGTIGKDISFLLPWLNVGPFKDKGVSVFRCEGVMAKKVFAKKYAKHYDNARNLVAGILNRSLKKGEEPDPAIKDIDIVVLGKYGERIGDTLFKAERKGYLVPESVGCKGFNPRLLSSTLAQFCEGLYEIDGLVIAPTGHVFEYKDADKPSWTVAYKENTEADKAAIAEVVDVIWQVSKAKRLTPKVKIRPIRLDGVTVTYATSHNAEWAEEQGIGPGARIRIVRSGGVIPKIVGVVNRAKFKGPDVAYERNGVHFYATNDTEDRVVKEITHYVQSHEVEHVKAATIKKLVDQGLISSVVDLIKLVSQKTEVTARKIALALDLDQQGKRVRTIVLELQKLRSSDMITSMVASNTFPPGIGERIIKTIDAKVSVNRLLGLPFEEVQARITGIRDIGERTAYLFAKGLMKYERFYNRINSMVDVAYIPQKKVALPKGKYSGMGATWTGYRSKEEEAEWTSKGGDVVPFGSKTSVLFVKLGGKPSSKVAQAQVRKIPVLFWRDRP